MRTDRATAWMLAVACAAVTGLAAPASQAQSCLTTAQSVEKATSSSTDYVYDSAGHAVDARGVSWLDIPDHVLSLDGSADGCWDGGRIDGPYPENAVYECSSEHCPSSGCPSPCLPYHTTAGMAPNDGARVIENVHIKDYGDGISVESASGDIVAKGVWFENIHDDAMETDYAHQSMSCLECLFERANMIMAFDRRSSADGNVPIPGWTIELRDSLVQLHRFSRRVIRRSRRSSSASRAASCLCRWIMLEFRTPITATRSEGAAVRAEGSGWGAGRATCRATFSITRSVM